MNTIGLIEAAALCRVHPNTLQERARAGLVPAAKIGREWIFVPEDLLAHIRAQYQCPSTDKKAAPSGGTAFTTAVNGYVNQLNKLIAKRRKGSMTK